ncbi:MAG: VOC family protein [Bacteroidota bacterium]
MNINQITLPKLDLNQSILFYQILGLELIVRAEKRYARFLYPNGPATCSLHPVEKLPTGDGTQMYFEYEHLDQEVDRLEKASMAFILDPTDQPWLRREAHLQDPDGNYLNLFLAGEHRINPPWRLDPPAH